MFVIFWTSVLDSFGCSPEERHTDSASTILSPVLSSPLPVGLNPCCSSCQSLHLRHFHVLWLQGVFYKHTAWELRGFPLSGKQLWGAWPMSTLWRVRCHLWSCMWGRCTGWVPIVMPEDSPWEAKKGSLLCSLPSPPVWLLINDFAYYKTPYLLIFMLSASSTFQRLIAEGL